MRINKSELYYVGRYKSPLIYHFTIMPVFEGTQKLPQISGGLVLDGHCFFLKKEWMEIKKRTRKAIENKDSSFFNHLFALAKKCTTTIIADSKNLRTSDEINRFFEHFHQMEYPWWMTIPVGEAIEEYLNGNAEFLKLPASSRQSFFSLKKKTLLMQQEAEMQKIENKIRKAGLKFDLQRIKRKGGKIFEEIQAHVAKYRWFGMMHFWGEPFSEEKLIAQMKLAKADKVEHVPKLSRDLTWIMRICTDLSFWRQTCADTCAIASLAAMEQFGNIGKRTGVDYEMIMWLTPIEFIEFLKKNKLSDSDAVKERRKAFGVITVGKEREVVTGTELQEQIEQLLPKSDQTAEVKGIVACEGNAKGVAKIILTPSDLGKINFGDIIVATETTPDFVPVLHKVRGIITDLGGISSHAAIISREIGIPCIIGTRIATKVFKDGERIEMNANSGLIRRLPGRL